MRASAGRAIGRARARAPGRRAAFSCADVSQGLGYPAAQSMLATQVRQKDSVFYFAAYPAEDLLDRVRFISRFYADGERSLAPDDAEEGDEVARFIAKIERTDAAFQRELSRS